MVEEQFYSGLILILLISGLPLLGSMIVGLVVSVFQAATQVQEQTLSFVPKLLFLFATFIFAGDWLFSKLKVLFESSLLLMISLQS